MDDIVETMGSDELNTVGTDHLCNKQVAVPSKVVVQDATTVARSQMGPHEADDWDHYLRGEIKLPAIDWEHDRGEVATGKKGQQNEKRRAEALNRLYNVQCAEGFHAAWVLSNRPELLPLLKAVARVIGAERQYGSRRGIDVVTPLARVQNLNRAISTLTQQRRQHASDMSLPKRQMDGQISSYIDCRREVRQQRLADRLAIGQATRHVFAPSTDLTTVTESSKPPSTRKDE